ncbi:hypothetical protein [Histophilus somni]|uniref:hypothetical protein n=1 Tax=Histophilus somni TaxID=731 RepID=UPI0010A9EE31|nr:hypothetical protein [Histophilus somni]QQF78520.1 hypothetical protein JFL53_08350 [Histophilus somni]TJY52340.1 hypothetical protein FAZ28_04730 [Histophilus somni]
MRFCLIGLCILLTSCVVPTSTKDQTAIPVPIFIGVSEQTDFDAIHVCTLKPFTQEYRSEHTNRGRAKLNVQRQCQAQHSEMFCEEKDIVCRTYE